MAKLSLSKAWDETRAALGADGKLYVAIALALIALPATIYGTMEPAALLGGAPQGGSPQIVFLVVMLINLLGRLALSRLALRPASVGEAIGASARRLPAVVGAFLIFLVPFIAGLTPFLPQVMANPQSPPPGPLLISTFIIILAFILGVRLALPLVPLAAAEAGGPLTLLKRGWRITSGNWWRLAVFLFAFFIASVLTVRAIGYVIGGAVILAAGRLEPMALSSLILAAVLALVGAAFTTVFSVMLARIYVQLAAPAAGVPSSGT